MSKWTKVYTLEGVTDFYADDDFEDALREVFGEEQDLSVKVRITVENDDEAAAELSALRERVEALTWVAKRLEFIYADDVIDAYLCPICRGEKPTHYVDCELATALQAP